MESIIYSTISLKTNDSAKKTYSLLYKRLQLSLVGLNGQSRDCALN